VVKLRAQRVLLQIMRVLKGGGRGARPGEISLAVCAGKAVKLFMLRSLKIADHRLQLAPVC